MFEQLMGTSEWNAVVCIYLTQGVTILDMGVLEKNVALLEEACHCGGEPPPNPPNHVGASLLVAIR